MQSLFYALSWPIGKSGHIRSYRSYDISYWRYLDPIGALLVSAYIAITWFLTGKQHVIMMSGRTAQPQFIARIMNICIEHDHRIDYVDTLHVYHFGTKFLVEVNIVLNDTLSLKTTSDISNRLKVDIERLTEVERAFVHCDCLIDQFVEYTRHEDKHMPISIV